MISAINSFKNQAINNINFLGRKKQTPDYTHLGYTKLEGTDVYVSRTVTPSGIIIDKGISETQLKKLAKRFDELSTPNSDNGSVRLVDKKGEVTILPRPLTSDELKECNRGGFLNKNDKVRKYIELKDMGVSTNLAIDVNTRSEKTASKFRALITPDAKGECVFQDKDGADIKLSRPLTPNEAAHILFARNKKVSDENIETFINLKDNYGLDSADASALAHSPRLCHRFIDLTTADEDGSVKLYDEEQSVTLYRALTSKEAIMAVETQIDRLPSYLQILDMGLTPYEAHDIVSNAPRAKRFFSLTVPNKNGQVVLVNKNGDEYILDRPLTPKEAQIAMREHFSNEKIQSQLETQGRVSSIRRYQTTI